MSSPSIPTLSDFDQYLWAASRHYRAYQKLGAHLCQHEGRSGVHFAVWAPHAVKVSVIGEFNGWREGAAPLDKNHETGIWSGFVEGVGHGDAYKYSIRSELNDYHTERADPYAFCAELRPNTASRVWDLQRHEWQDSEWMEKRQAWNPHREAVNIYEVHLGSWRKSDGNWLTYREMAPLLADYAVDMGYTHVEILPVTEFPYDGSWGYQVVGYFAPTSRFGQPEDFMALVDTLHQRGIGVILDWVPAHFPTDGFALGYFDGSHLYEHADPRKGFHPEWSTFIFNYGQSEVSNFLVSSAMFWLDKYHIDGLRVDAVASMLYLDYGRNQGEWLPNRFGGRENLEAVAFLELLNESIAKEYPGVMTMAEESTAWPHVSKPTGDGGLGFTFKWNMGWMNDTLAYFKQDPIHRSYHHNKLTFGMSYQYSENFLLPLSHDEVVHGKASLIHKMPGDDWQKFANLRLLMGYQIGHPGKKLMFMGAEIGQRREWDFGGQIDWHLLEHESHKGVQNWARDLNLLYQHEPAAYQLDSHPEGFCWMECDDKDTSVFSFVRFADQPRSALLFVCNFTPVPRPDYRVALPWPGRWTQALNSDDHRYGGSGVGVGHDLESEEIPHKHQQYSAQLEVPPLAVLVFRGPEPPPLPAVAHQEKLPDRKVALAETVAAWEASPSQAPATTN
jgi:1,4-alpha-glucan branching enzyme